MKIEFSGQISWEYSNIKFHENPSSGSPDVPCGRTNGQIDMKQLIAAFRNFATPQRTCCYWNACLTVHSDCTSNLYNACKQKLIYVSMDFWFILSSHTVQRVWNVGIMNDENKKKIQKTIPTLKGQIPVEEVVTDMLW